MKVLVVDNVALVGRTLRHSLEPHGHEVITEESGEAAIDRLQRDLQIEVVITELTMRQMNGLELFRRCNALERFDDHGEVSPPVFVLMTSVRPTAGAAPAELRLLRDAMRLGFAAVLAKPVERELLLRTLDHVGGLGSHADSTSTARADSSIRFVNQGSTQAAKPSGRGPVATSTDQLHDAVRRLDKRWEQMGNRLDSIDDRQQVLDDTLKQLAVRQDRISEKMSHLLERLGAVESNQHADHPTTSPG